MSTPDLYPELPEDFTGEMGKESEDLARVVQHCRMLWAETKRLTDELNGAEKDIRAWRVRYADLERDKERDAKASPLWPVCERVFVVWRDATGRDKKRTKFRLDRFELIRRFLKDLGEDEIPEVSYDRETGPPQNLLEECFAAVLGLAYDCFEDTNKNGKPVRYNDLKHAFGDSKLFEAKREKRPRDWRARLRKLDPEAPPEDALPGMDEAA